MARFLWRQEDTEKQLESFRIEKCIKWKFPGLVHFKDEL